LRLIRPDHARPHPRAQHRLGMIKQKNVRRLRERNPHRRTNQPPQRRKMPVRAKARGIGAGAGSFQQRRERHQRPRRRATFSIARRRTQGAVPDGEQGAALGEASAAGDGAGGAGVEGVVEGGEAGGVTVGGEEVGEGCGGEGGEGEVEEVVERVGGGEGLVVVGEVGF